ncbi:M15 family metallopeptidase [Candidatus Pacearchaeota archaeon]|nr:M15 family metallopeptidase [Candidatus Pacearchaeota archaeon]
MVGQKLYKTEELGKHGQAHEMVKAPFPFPLYLGGDKKQVCRTFYGNKLIVESVIDAFQEILDTFGLKSIRKNGYDNYGGCYNNRKSRGYDQLSDHAWGMAIDYLPQYGPLGRPSVIPDEIVDIFKKRGFIWGGDWKRTDGMHFSARKQ